MDSKNADTDRRNFLKRASVSAPAAVAAVAVGSESAAAAEAEIGEGLRKTEHVRKYLESARF